MDCYCTISQPSDWFYLTLNAQWCWNIGVLPHTFLRVYIWRST
jgi:hypothetical protein